MSDLIERQAAIDALRNQMSDWNDDYNVPVRKSIKNIEQLPSAQPETHVERTETHECDLISRQAAIDAIDKIFPADPMKNEYTQGITCGAALAEEYIKQLPSAQPEKIYCQDCKYASPNGVYGCRLERFSVHDESIRLFAGDYCSAAERR